MKLKSSEEFVKYMTSRAVGFFATPKVERRLKREHRKVGWSTHWFGMLPIALSMWRSKKK